MNAIETGIAGRVRGGRAAVTGVLIVVGVASMATLTHWAPGLANDTSRLATAEALVEHGQFAIDGTHFAYTVDKIEVAGRFYSDKPPLFSIYLAALYGVLNFVFGWSMESHLPAVYYTSTLLSSGLAFVATLLGVRRLAEGFGASPLAAGGTALAGGFATLMFPYAVVISSHAAAAPFLVWYAVLLAENPGELAPASAVGAGLLGALAALIEPLAATFVVPLGVGWLLGSGQYRTAGWFVAGGLVAFLPHAIVTHQISGNPLLMNLDPAHFDYRGSMHRAENLSGVGWAHDSFGGFLRYAYHSVVGYRGAILYNMPAAVGTGAAVWAVWRGRFRWMTTSALAGAVLFFALTIGWTSNYSGWAYGVRWHATPAPLMTAFLALALGGEETVRRIGRFALGVALLLGTASAAPGTVDPWTPSSHRAYSVVELFSSDPAYVNEHLDAAAGHLRAGRLVEARHQAEHAIRRAPSVPAGWKIAIRAAARLGETSRLREYRRRLEAGEGPREKEIRRRMIRRIDAPLEKPDS